MNHYRKSNPEDMAAARLARIRHESLPRDEQLAQRLVDLQAFVCQLARTPHGSAELQLRTQRFGACAPVDGESPRDYYGKLRRWLDRECGEADVAVGSARRN
jgi:hypothetical protein